MCSFELGESYYHSLYLAGVGAPLSGADDYISSSEPAVIYSGLPHYYASSACLPGFYWPLQFGPIPPNSSSSSLYRDTLPSHQIGIVGSPRFRHRNTLPALFLCKSILHSFAQTLLPQKISPCTYSPTICFPSSLYIYFFKYIIWPLKCFCTFLQMQFRPLEGRPMCSSVH